jgi:hypothetical protein
MSRPLYAIRQWFYGRRFLNVIRRIAMAPIEELRDPAQVSQLVRAAGLHFDERGAYGSDSAFMNWQCDGLWQNPVQLGQCLAELSKHKIESFIEIGTSKGWTCSFIIAYLKRFNPGIQAVTVDPVPQFLLYEKVRTMLPLEYAAGKTSVNFKCQVFDLAFIDGDHSHPWLLKDYENVGRAAKIAMFHDINDDFVANKPGNEGGVRRFWQELKQAEADTADFFEFTDHSKGDNFMGIGIRIIKA